MNQMSEGLEFELKDHHHALRTTIAVQHTRSEPNQSVGVMFFRERDEILLGLDEDGTAEMIIGILKRWEGKHPDKFQKIKSLL